MRTPGESPAFSFWGSRVRRSGREQLLTLRPVDRLAQRDLKLVEQLIDLRRLDHKRRANRDDVAYRAHDQAFGLRETNELRSDQFLRIERRLAALVSRQ